VTAMVVGSGALLGIFFRILLRDQNPLLHNLHVFLNVPFGGDLAVEPYRWISAALPVKQDAISTPTNRFVGRYHRHGRADDKKNAGTSFIRKLPASEDTEGRNSRAQPHEHGETIPKHWNVGVRRRARAQLHQRDLKPTPAGKTLRRHENHLVVHIELEGRQSLLSLDELHFA